MAYLDRPRLIPCHGARMVGIVCLPAAVPLQGDVGVLIIVGGPQYRAGSHRQFTLLARHLADRGIPSLRFDYRGMGDSEGDARTFEDIADDVRSAVDALTEAVPGVRRVVLWGLCDGATAAALYAWRDGRVAGIVLLNPWVQDAQAHAQAVLKTYYVGRLADPRFWRSLMTGKIHPFRSLASLVRTVIDAARRAPETAATASMPGACGSDRAPPVAAPRALVTSVTAGALSPGDLLPLSTRMRQSLARYSGKVLLVLSGNDITAQEFDSLWRSQKNWRDTLGRLALRRIDVKEADHTFSRADWSERVALETADWILNMQHDSEYGRTAQ